MRRGFLAAIVCLALVQGPSPREVAAQSPAETPPNPQATAPAEAPGTIAGTVIDKSTGDPIIEAGVEVIGLKKKTRTDIDGKYSIKVPPGTYEVRFFAPLYQGARIEKVTVKSNEVTKVSTPLSAAVAGVEVVEVVAKAKKASEQTQLLEAPEGGDHSGQHRRGNDREDDRTRMPARSWHGSPASRSRPTSSSTSAASANATASRC